MKVYVLCTGSYEARGVAGVFSTPELAMAAVASADDWREESGEYGAWNTAPGGWHTWTSYKTEADIEELELDAHV